MKISHQALVIIRLPEVARMTLRLSLVLVVLYSLSGFGAERESTGFVNAHDGVRLYYRKFGDGAQKVIIPGGFLFYRDLDRLASPGRTLIFYDMRNRGHSDAVKDLAQVTMQNDVRDLESIRAHFGVEKATLIGYSYLGFMVVLYAKDHPEHVERIIQLGPVPRQWDTQYPAALTNGDAQQVVDRKARDEVEELRKQGYDQSHPKEFCEKYWKVFRRLLVGKAENAERIPGWCDLPNEWPVNFAKHLQAHFVGSVQKLKVPKEAVVTVSMPVLTIHGTKDRNAPYGAGREWAMTLPNARLVTVAGAAHQSWADEPELVLDAIDTFLRGEWPAEAEKIASLESSAQHNVQDLGWLAGTWLFRSNGKTVEEHWTTPEGGMMLGVGRTIANGTTVEFEFLRIEQRADGLAYIAQPGGRAPTEFRLVHSDGDVWLFANPQHDFPTKVRYRRASANSLEARVEDESGARHVEFLYSRVE